MRLPDMEAWATFAAVAEHGSFSAAGASLGVGKATVSKTVARLERRLGQALFHRTSRRLALTQAGEALVGHAARLVAAARAAEEAAHDRDGALSGRIRVAAPLAFGAATVAPLVAAFLGDHPAVEIDLDLSDARVDIVAGGYDVALRIGDLPDSSLRARRLGSVDTLLVAAPAYLARRGTPVDAAALRDHALLRYANRPGPWRLRRGTGPEVSVEPAGPLRSNSGEALLPAAMAGLGIAVLPRFVVAGALADGALVELLPDWRPAPTGLHLLTPPSPLRPARVEALIEHLARGLGDACAAAIQREADLPPSRDA